MKKGLFILLALVVMTACSKGPESAAKNFSECMAKGDMVGAKKYATTKTAAMLDMMSGMTGGIDMPTYPDYKFKMIKDSIEGDSLAWVTFTDPQGKESVLNLKKEDGEWKVSMGK